MTKSLQVLSYDVGGSHATVGIVDSESLAISYLDSCAIDSNGTAESILNELFFLGVTAVEKLPTLSPIPDVNRLLFMIRASANRKRVSVIINLSALANPLHQQFHDIIIGDLPRDCNV